MLFNTVLLSILAVSVSSINASPLPSIVKDDALVLAARGLDIDQMPFEKRSLIPDVSGGMDVAERDLGEEALGLYIRDLEAPEMELERRSKIGKKIGNFVSYNPFILNALLYRLFVDAFV